MNAALTLRPAELMQRLRQISASEQTIDTEAPGASPPVQADPS